MNQKKQDNRAARGTEKNTAPLRKPFNYKLFWRRTALMIYDVISVILASYLAIIVRYNFRLDEIPRAFLIPIRNFMPLSILMTLGLFWVFRMYHSLWAYAGEQELQNLVISCVLSGVGNAVFLQLFRVEGYQPVPQSYYFLYTFFLIACEFVSRFSYRYLRSMKHKRENRDNAISVMVIGAGEAANIIIKEIIGSHFSTMTIRCVIDDDRLKWGRYIQGVKIIGGRDKIKEACALYDIDQIIVAMPSVPRAQMKEILSICSETGCKVRTLPGMYQLVNGEVSVSKLRDVEIEDLLGREPVQVDIGSIIGYVQNKVVCVTGGGGSIGSELCRQSAGHKPKQLIILDIYENNAYDIQQELKITHPELNLVVLIASIRNTRRMNWIFEHYRPDIVYHAAAHKHVPLMEDSPCEAIKNNVFGTFKTARAAAMNGVQTFVMISTDKAVNPTNVMGCSKRICEIYVQSLDKWLRQHQGTTQFVTTRFGNVLGSNGSVIPLFREQIKNGGPVTVTHPDIIRFFMLIPEACQLVLEAGVKGNGGEILVFDMGKPVRIADLAKRMIKLSGVKNVEVKYTGLRAGEKLYEEVLSNQENTKPSFHEKIRIAKVREYDFEVVSQEIDKLIEVSYTFDKLATVKEMKSIIPEYKSKNSVYEELDK